MAIGRVRVRAARRICRRAGSRCERGDPVVPGCGRARAHFGRARRGDAPPDRFEVVVVVNGPAAARTRAVRGPARTLAGSPDAARPDGDRRRLAGVEHRRAGLADGVADVRRRRRHGFTVVSRGTPRCGPSGDRAVDRDPRRSRRRFRRRVGIAQSAHPRRRRHHGGGSAPSPGVRIQCVEARADPLGEGGALRHGDDQRAGRRVLRHAVAATRHRVRRSGGRPRRCLPPRLLRHLDVTPGDELRILDRAAPRGDRNARPRATGGVRRGAWSPTTSSRGRCR